MNIDNKRAMVMAAIADVTKKRDDAERAMRSHQDSIDALKRQLTELTGHEPR